MQAFAEFLWQGKQFAYSVDKQMFADEENCCLEKMYRRMSLPQSMDEFLRKVCSSSQFLVAPAERHRLWLLEGPGLQWNAACSKCGRRMWPWSPRQRVLCGCPN